MTLRPHLVRRMSSLGKVPPSQMLTFSTTTSIPRNFGCCSSAWTTLPDGRRRRPTPTTPTAETTKRFLSTKIDYKKCSIPELVTLLRERGIVKPKGLRKQEMIQQLKIEDLVRVYEGWEEGGSRRDGKPKKPTKRQLTLQKVLQVVRKHEPIDVTNGYDKFQEAYWMEHRERWKVKASANKIGYKKFASMLKDIPEINRIKKKGPGPSRITLTIHPEHRITDEEKKRDDDDDKKESLSASSSLPRPNIGKEKTSTFGDSQPPTIQQNDAGPLEERVPKRLPSPRKKKKDETLS